MMKFVLFGLVLFVGHCYFVCSAPTKPLSRRCAYFIDENNTLSEIDLNEMPGPADKAKIMQALNAGGDLTRTIKIYDETDEYEYLKSSKDFLAHIASIEQDRNDGALYIVVNSNTLTDCGLDSNYDRLVEISNEVLRESP